MRSIAVLMPLMLLIGAAVALFATLRVLKRLIARHFSRRRA